MSKPRFVIKQEEPEKVSVEEEFEDYDVIKADKGLVLDPESVGTTNWIERTFSNPMTMIDTPLPWKAWQGIADLIYKEMRSTRSAASRHSMSMAWTFCKLHVKNKNNGLRPAHEQLAFMDMMRATDPKGRCDPAASGCLGRAIYLFTNNELMGRGVG